MTIYIPRRPRAINCIITCPWCRISTEMPMRYTLSESLALVTCPRCGASGREMYDAVNGMGLVGLAYRLFRKGKCGHHAMSTSFMRQRWRT